MKHISILIPHGHCSVVNIEGTHHIFNEVNTIRQSLEKSALFKVQLVGLADQTSQQNGLFTISPNVLIQDVKKTDLIVIPAIHGSPQGQATKSCCVATVAAPRTRSTLLPNL